MGFNLTQNPIVLIGYRRVIVKSAKAKEVEAITKYLISLFVCIDSLWLITGHLLVVP